MAEVRDPRQKIMSLQELSSLTAGLKAQGKKVVQCHGVFDLVHPGHIRHFWAARKEGDALIVTITPDEYVNKGPDRPVFNHRLRLESVAALECVDYVALNEWPTAVEAIRRLRPDVYVKGGDYTEPKDDLTGAIYTEIEAVKSVGGRVHYTNEITFSSTGLLNDYFEVLPQPAEDFLKEFRTRYTDREIIHQLNRLRGMRVLVMGETIVDEYHYCQAMGKSPKETILSVRYLEEEAFAGGALACANHVAGFCKEVQLVTTLGKVDSKENFIRGHLKPNITPKFFYQEGARTIVKRRFVEPAFLTKMFEVSFLDEQELPEALRREIARYLDATLIDYDIVIVTDYGHGLFHQDLVERLSERSHFLAVNTQTNSANLGYNLITKYPHADFICIDEPELRLATRSRHGPLEDLVHQVLGRVKTSKAAITRGHLGCLTYDAQGDEFWHAPVFSRKVVDRVGAGDAYLAIAAPCVAAGCPMDVVGFIGNAAGALAVAIVCNRSAVEPAQLYRFISALLK